MNTIKSFQNAIGKTEVIKYDEHAFVCTMDCELGGLHHFDEYRYRQDAIATYQFRCGWLEKQAEELSTHYVNFNR